MVEIHLYGNLRRYVPDTPANRGAVLNVKFEPDETLESLLKRVGISVDELYHIFLNGNLLSTHNAMALWVGYQQERPNVLNWDLNLPIKSGDRIGLFGRDMAALVV
jgi:hypothetical protein